MNLRDLMTKLDTIAEAPADPSRAQYDKFKADDARAAAVEQVKKLMATPLNDIPRLGDAIDPKTGIIYYGEAGQDAFQGTAKPYPYKWLADPASTSDQSRAMYKILGPAGLKVIPVEKKGLFGSYQVAGISPQQLADLDKPVAPAPGEVVPGKAPETGQGGKPAPCAEKIAKLNALIQKLAAAKKGDSGQGGKSEGSGDVMQRLKSVGVPVKGVTESTELGIEQQLLLEFGYSELDEYSMQQFSQDASDLGRGAWNGVTLGSGDNIVAGARSLVKGTKYKDELGREVKATKDAEARSPYLYGGANLAGSVLAPIPGGAVGALAAKGAKALGAGKGLTTAASLGGNVAANIAAAQAVGSAVKSHNDTVLAPAGQGGKPQGDPKVLTLQKNLIAAGAKIKADGVMGPATQAAMKQYPAALKGYPWMTGAIVKESLAESMGSLRDRLASLENDQQLDEYGGFLARLFGKGGDDAATAATKVVPPKVVPPKVTPPGTVNRARPNNPNAAKAELPGAAPVTKDLTGAPIKPGELSATGSIGASRAQAAADNAVDAGRAASKATQASVDDMVRGGAGAADNVAGAGAKAADDVAGAGGKVAGAADNVAGAGGKVVGAADDVAGAGGKVAGAADNVAGAGAKAADNVAGAGGKVVGAADNVVDDAAKAAAAAEAKAASKAGKLTQWAKANPKKAVAIGLIAAGTGAYVGNRVFGGDDPSPAPVTPPAPNTPPPAVDTTDIENEITALIRELEKEPECQKELAALKQQLAGITGKTADTAPSTVDYRISTAPAAAGAKLNAMKESSDELDRWLKIARG